MRRDRGAPPHTQKFNAFDRSQFVFDSHDASAILFGPRFHRIDHTLAPSAVIPSSPRG